MYKACRWFHLPRERVLRCNQGKLQSVQGPAAVSWHVVGTRKHVEDFNHLGLSRVTT